MLGYSILSVFVVGLAIIIIRTLTFKRENNKGIQWQTLEINGDRIAQKMSSAIKIPTVSYMDQTKVDYGSFKNYHELMAEAFPLVHTKLDKTVINDYSLLYYFKGKDEAKAPSLFMAHMDVVPIAEGTEEDWKYPAFSGAIEEGFVWGRGALDTKVTMIAALEAAELLLEKGYQPERDLYFAFGHDEEVQGTQGAVKIAQYLEKQGVEIGFVLDEGGIVSTDSIKEVDESLAIIGIAEKGYADIELSVKGGGGHASMPPSSTALGQISQAIVNLEKHQMPLRMTKPVEIFFEQIGPSMSLVNKTILANLWLFKPLFIRIFSKSNTGNALLRTTTAPTMSKASNAPNVLPQEAKATVNFRVAPGESVASVVAHIKRVNKDIDLEVKVLQGNEPTEISSLTSEGYKAIAEVANHVFEDVIVAPYMVMAATDSRNFSGIAKDIYRFAPLVVDREALATIHNTNERVSIDNLVKCVSFYMHLMMEL